MENLEPYKNSKQHTYLPTLVALGIGVGILIGIFISKYNYPIKDIQHASKKYGTILSIIENDYVDSVDVEQLFESSIYSMLEQLDPHTSYTPARDLALVQSQLEGGFEGVGIEFHIMNDTLYVITAISGGPSEKAGLKAGDKIIKVDGKNVAGTGMETNDVFNLLRGQKGTKVILSVKRNNNKELLKFEIERDKIPTYSVDASYMLNDKTGYIKVSRFAENTYKEFKEGLTKLKDKGMSQLILDLRDNGGGYMSVAIGMAEELLKKGSLIVYTDGRLDQYRETHRSSRNGLFENENLIVLINENSASASEIVAGALQDNDRALIVGRRSFGKGLVQAPIRLDDGSELRLTISRYYTPSGRCIQKSYSLEEEYSDDYVKRYENGELFYADSIKIVDTLKYKTTHGRTVYGGGGIIPDDFVAKDTLGYTDYLGKLYSENIIRQFVLSYVNENKEKLEPKGFETFKNSFNVTNAMVNEIVKRAEQAQIKTNRKQLRLSEGKLKEDVKSIIARSIWGNSSYYEITNQSDPMILKSLQLFDKAEKIRKGEI